MNLQEQPIGQVACALPGATRIFHEYKLDFCCGGHISLSEAAAKRGVDLSTLLARLEPLQPTGTTLNDWREAPASDLIDHILTRFHESHREEIPELIRLARRVEHVHAGRPDCPTGLADHLEAMLQDLQDHMAKEEEVLFPMLLAGNDAGAQAPISTLRHEHDQHGVALARLEALTDDITAPKDACNTWRALYAGLTKLREDLMQHIHLENNVLFVNAGHVV